MFAWERERQYVCVLYTYSNSVDKCVQHFGKEQIKKEAKEILVKASTPRKAKGPQTTRLGTSRSQPHAAPRRNRAKSAPAVRITEHSATWRDSSFDWRKDLDKVGFLCCWVTLLTQMFLFWKSFILWHSPTTPAVWPWSSTLNLHYCFVVHPVLLFCGAEDGFVFVYLFCAWVCVGVCVFVCVHVCVYVCVHTCVCSFLVLHSCTWVCSVSNKTVWFRQLKSLVRLCVWSFFLHVHGWMYSLPYRAGRWSLTFGKECSCI